MKKIIYSIGALFLCVPLLANAAQGWVVADISMQAGPDPEYPSIIELGAGTPVSIVGCIDDWAWCDVIANDERGWVPGTYLQEDYGGQRVYVIDYGSRIGVPIVSFSLGLYWSSHYHNRAFYAQRQQWESRAIRPHAPTRPTGVTASRPAEQRSSTSTPERRAPTPASVPKATTTTTEREAPRAERPADQVRTMQAKPERPPVVKSSDAAERMRPTTTPKAEPRPQQAMPKAQAPRPTNESKAKAPPKATDERKTPEKKKDNGDNGSGK